jgi:hypothetical protein
MVSASRRIKGLADPRASNMFRSAPPLTLPINLGDNFCQPCLGHGERRGTRSWNYSSGATCRLNPWACGEDTAGNLTTLRNFLVQAPSIAATVQPFERSVSVPRRVHRKIEKLPIRAQCESGNPTNSSAVSLRPHFFEQEAFQRSSPDQAAMQLTVYVRLASSGKNSQSLP